MLCIQTSVGNGIRRDHSEACLRRRMMAVHKQMVSAHYSEGPLF